MVLEDSIYELRSLQPYVELGGVNMATKLFMELKRLFADLASTLILGKNRDAANIALILSEKSKALAEELAK